MSVVFAHGFRACQVSKKRLRNRARICWCLGWWFPHRICSRASREMQRTHGTRGCIHAP